MDALDVLRLIATALTPAIVAILLHFIIKKWKWFNSRNYLFQQVAIGIIFSILCLLSFYLGVDYKSVTSRGVYTDVVGNFGSANACPLIAGLIFGGPSGLIAGFTASIYRLFIYPFGSHDFLRGAECITVFLAGVIAWILRVSLFDNKKPKWFYGLIIGIFIETIHMLLLFTFAMSQLESIYAYGIVRVCDIACALTVASALMISLIGITFLEKDKLFVKVKNDKRISTKIQRWFATTFAISLTVTIVFTGLANYQKSSYEVNQTLTTHCNDVYDEVKSNGLIYNYEGDIKSDKDKYIRECSATYNATKFHRINLSGFCGLLDGKYTENEFRLVSYNNEFDPEAGSDLYLGTSFHFSDPDVVGKFHSVNEYQENVVYKVYLRIDGVVYEYFMRYKSIDLQMIEGHTRSFYVVSMIFVYEAKMNMGMTVRLTSYLELLIFIIIFGVIYAFIKKVVVSNIHKINDSLDLITGGNLNIRVEVRSNQEFSDLSDDINQTVDTLKRFIDEANKRIDKELQFAKEIQFSSLPYIFPKSEYYDLHASMNTAKQVGGDFYDFFEVNKDTVFFSIADVSGKGIPAALFMMKAKTLIKSLIQTEELTLDNIISLVNDELNDHNDAMMFVTAWFGLFNLKTGRLEFVNAGHNPPLIKTNGEKYKEIPMKKNFVLAGIENFKYELETVDLKPGDEIILYTDGVTEATNSKLELYGTARFIDLVNKAKYNNATELTEIITKDLKTFQGESDQADDITMVVLRYKKIKKN